MDHYNTGKMRSGAQEIRDELKTYSAAKQSMDDIVSSLKNNWIDATNTKYANKYNQEAEPAADSVRKVMEAYAKLLEESAAGYEKVQQTAQQGL